MARLILVPQYPARLRYQEWWLELFPGRFSAYFDEVIVLDPPLDNQEYGDAVFSPMENALEYEARQVSLYADLVLKPNDHLLLCDLSYPGLFANVLMLKRPSRCFAICHATSKNRYDYFSHIRDTKWPIETHQAKLFDRIFVATDYHAVKLGWDNVFIHPLPNPPYHSSPFRFHKTKTIVNVSRPGIQKRNLKFEKQLKAATGFKIETPPTRFKSWAEYYDFLGAAKILLITAKEETYGYQVVDAVLNNCVPIAPRAYSYPALLPDEYLYDTLEECVTRIAQVMNGKLFTPTLLTEVESRQFYKVLSHVMLYE